MSRGRRCLEAFTLVEVLAVIAVVAVLASIVLGVGGRVHARVAISRAEAEMAVLAEALERYRAAYGDYPQTSPALAPEVSLYGALIGRLTPRGEILPSTRADRGWIALSALAVGAVGGGDPVVLDPLIVAGVPVGPDRDWAIHVFLDPWGSPYVYRYGGAGTATWERQGYLLLSLGPSGGINREKGVVERSELPESGLLPLDYHQLGDAYDNILFQP